MEGWIKLHRKLLSWEWYRDGNTLRLFLHLLLSANHQPTRWRGRVIEQGQVLTGRHLLSKQTGLSERSIRTSLTKLKTTSELTIETTSKFSIITLVKYREYQISNKQTTSKTTSKPSDKRPATDHIQEGKELKEEDIEAPPSGKKPPDPRVKSFIDYIKMSFKKKTNEEMHIHYAKDGAIVKSLLQTYDLPKLQSLWDIFITSTDPFIVKAGFTIGVFQTQVNKLISQPPPKRDWKTNPEGVKS